MSGPELPVERGSAVRNLASSSGRNFLGFFEDFFQGLQKASTRGFIPLLIGFYRGCIRCVNRSFSF